MLGWELHTRLAPEAVWSGVDSPAALGEWFPCHVSGSFLPGGALSFRFEGASRGEDLVLPGTLVCLDAVDGGSSPDRWCIDWAGDLLTLTVADVAPADAAPGGAGGAGAVLRFSARLEQLGRAARDAAGWHVCLAGLASRLGDPATERDADWEAQFASYAQAFGADAATELPPGR